MSKLARRKPTTFRRAFAEWEETAGKKFFNHTTGQPNYAFGTVEHFERDTSGVRRPIGHTVYPKNPAFISQPVLSDRLKNEVYRSVTKDGRSIRQTSVDYKIDIRRVGAVIRLKEIEKQWRAEGKPLATVYSEAVMPMLPQTPLENPRLEHEPINDLIVHPSTRPQLFWPVAESQRFTRVEAGKAFEASLLPAEARIPHRQLYKIAKRVAGGLSQAEATQEEWARVEQEDKDALNRFKDKTKKIEERTTVVQTPRWQYKFESVTVNKSSVGKYVDAIGQRYGVPHQDRKKGHQDRIPSRVDG